MLLDYYKICPKQTKSYMYVHV